MSDNLNGKRCPYCWAPIAPEENRCSYCGTSYFDLSSIDINDREPFYLKIKVGNNTITQLVRVSEASLEFSSDNSYCSRNGNILASFRTNNSLFTNLSFEAVPESNRLCIVTEE